ncbi:unnamed protein product [Medioppia subpectinata]|uniref:Uncharacterized protein n=1 Tax=Medioppia subpectinata TaxID=1979941 RepID=A0A7R9KG39_9ACAR|nr:unnamed protein product [Medioppia subpectinata]CAG2102760.1 unnamed protein product [Medioppia subpectinata]
MLRLNRFFISRHLSQLSNVWMKSSYYYSSEPPDKSYTLGRIPAPERTRSPAIDSTDTFLRATNHEMSLFGPHDLRAPLNGNIGLTFEESTYDLPNEQLIQFMRQINTLNPKLAVIETTDIDIDLFLSNSYKSRCHKFFRILKYQSLVAQDMASEAHTWDGVDCSAHNLTTQVIKKFANLFPKSKRQELSAGLTAITMSQKTVNDMSGYSEAIELEREDFFEKFVLNAKTVCQELRDNGFWADFIDPYSGQPFLSEHTNETLFETDDRFIHLGFTIEDLGCCKAIYHHKWGTHVIVGTLFTTAPSDSPALIKLMPQSFDSTNK